MIVGNDNLLDHTRFGGNGVGIIETIFDPQDGDGQSLIKGAIDRVQVFRGLSHILSPITLESHHEHIRRQFAKTFSKIFREINLKAIFLFDYLPAIVMQFLDPSSKVWVWLTK